MKTNKANENTTEFTISTTTATMLRLLRDFEELQERAIALYEDKEKREDVIDATVEVMKAMQDAIAANVCGTMRESLYREI